MLVTIKSEAIGVDNIGIKMLCKCSLYYFNILTYKLIVILKHIRFLIYGKVHSCSQFLKKLNPSELKDIRPISILPTMSKILERVLQSQIGVYIENFNLLPSMQIGFRKDHRHLQTKSSVAPGGIKILRI